LFGQKAKLAALEPWDHLQELAINGAVIESTEEIAAETAARAQMIDNNPLLE